MPTNSVCLMMGTHYTCWDNTVHVTLMSKSILVMTWHVFSTRASATIMIIKASQCMLWMILMKYINQMLFCPNSFKIKLIWYLHSTFWGVSHIFNTLNSQYIMVKCNKTLNSIWMEESYIFLRLWTHKSKDTSRYGECTEVEFYESSLTNWANYIEVVLQ